MKLYEEMVAGLRGFFGKPDATESELQQALADASTVDQLKAAIKAEIEGGISDAQAALEAKVNGLTESLQNTQAEVAQLREDLAKAQAEIADKDKQLAEKDGQIAQLSADLAKARASAGQKTAAPPTDPAPPAPGAKTAGGSVVLTNEVFASMFGK